MTFSSLIAASCGDVVTANPLIISPLRLLAVAPGCDLTPWSPLLRGEGESSRSPRSLGEGLGVRACPYSNLKKREASATQTTAQAPSTAISIHIGKSGTPPVVTWRKASAR